MSLANNVSLARLALCIEAVEFLIEPLLGRLARVDWLYVPSFGAFVIRSTQSI